MQSRIWTALLICLCAPAICAAQDGPPQDEDVGAKSARGETRPLGRLYSWFAPADEEISSDTGEESTVENASIELISHEQAVEPSPSNQQPRRPSVTTRRELLRSETALPASPAPTWYSGSTYDDLGPREPGIPPADAWGAGSGSTSSNAASWTGAAPSDAVFGSGEPSHSVLAPAWGGPPVGLTPGPIEVGYPQLPPGEPFGAPVFTPEATGPVIATPMFGDVLQEEYHAFEHPPVPYHERVHGCFSSGSWWFRDRVDAFFGKGECDNPWKRLFYLGAKEQSCDIGIGRERVGLAPFLLDVAQPFNNFRLSYNAAYGLRTPDRASYFWAKPGQGPPALGEDVDYQDLRLYSEIGGESASAFTEVGLRSVDPLFAGNTTGFGDMTAGGKVLLVNGTYWKLAQITKTHINTGSPKKGLGRGHVAIEPGVLARYKWNDETYLHSQLTFWFPVGADPAYAGQILRYGFGVSYLGCETDRFALIHTAEWLGMTFIDGQVSTLLGVADVDGEAVNTFLYGLRAVVGPAGDLGLFEAGLAGGFGTGSDWIDGMLRMELRWSY